MDLIFQIQREKIAQKHVPIAKQHLGQKTLSTGVKQSTLMENEISIL